MMAIESPFVSADVIEATEFPELSEQYMVRGVPKTIVNNIEEMEGAYPEPHFLDAVMRAAMPEAAGDR